MKTIYLDYNATHPPFQDILESNLKNYNENFYNPSGSTRFSLRRQGIIEEARTYFSELCKKGKDSFVFCSTGTEANHLLLGILGSTLDFPARVYTSPFEHTSIYGALRHFGIEQILIKALPNGRIDLEDLETKLRSNPCPVVCILAANETGVLQPYGEIYQLCKHFGVQFFSDLMQAFAKIEIDFSKLDGFTASAHKIGGGMGSSLVCIPESWASLEYKLFYGGNQENGKRAGTENTFAIQSFVDASLLQYKEMESKNKRLMEFRSLIDGGMKDLGCKIIAEFAPRLPSTTFLILPTEDIDFYMMGLEEQGIIVSTGSSCKSRSREPSFSLLQMGYTKDEALRAIRISTGIFTTKEEIQTFLSASQKLLDVLK
jgi:cysteine desulfurase